MNGYCFSAQGGGFCLKKQNQFLKAVLCLLERIGLLCRY